MKSFLLELAEKLYKSDPRLSAATLIFPNRRAALYFRKHLSELITKPTFTPTLITIEDFIGLHSPLQVPDKLELIHCLHRAYNRVVENQEPFDQFYFWGEMLLRDFDELDKYMIQASHLFKDLSHQKEIDTSFDFLTPEQLDFLKNFWNNFDENLSANKKKFIHVWKQLPDVYNTFKLQLRNSGKAFDGMLQRDVAEQFMDGHGKATVKNDRLIFVGFNALTKAEDKIISCCVDQLQADVYWDLDAYYVNNNTQEAGLFFREYQQHAILSKTFSDVPANFSNAKSVSILGASQHVGQAKALAHVLHQELQKGMIPEETLIVLPDEKLMLPVLHGVSSTVEKLNVTMGFSLSSTPVFNLIELLIEMQINKRSDEFNHKQVQALLGHPYVVASDTALSNRKRKDINKQNRIYIPTDWLQTDSLLHQRIFTKIESLATGQIDITDYLRKIIIHLATFGNLTELDKEYCFHFLKFINRMDEVLTIDSASTNNIETKKSSQITDRESLKSFLRLFRQVIRAQKIPFTGEPLKGLQIMGVLETRNLDFKNIFILSLNEGGLPSGGSKGSYIPYTIRKAYGLPTAEHQDAIYAYLFYRSLQRAENVFLFYNTETDVLGQGEMSRYLQQIVYESGWTLERRTLHNPIQPHPILPIEIKKNQEVLDKLKIFQQGHPAGRGFYPTNLIDYLECRLRFYLKHIANIREAVEVEDDMDARILGSFVHRVMQLFYEQLVSTKENQLLEAHDLEEQKKNISKLIDVVFIETYNLDQNKSINYDGQRLVVREIVKQFAERIVEKDIEYAPFYIEGLEREGLTYALPLHNRSVMLKGIIDRIDRKDDTLRIIDYKTGKDKVEIRGGLSSLFSREGELNKAAFQTLYYALLYKTNHPHVEGRINAGIFNRNSLFGDEVFGLKLNNERLTNVIQLLPEFERNLQAVLEEIFNVDQSFDQTTDINKCKNCSYQNICYR